MIFQSGSAGCILGARFSELEYLSISSAGTSPLPQKIHIILSSESTGVENTTGFLASLVGFLS